MKQQWRIWPRVSRVGSFSIKPARAKQIQLRIVIGSAQAHADASFVLERSARLKENFVFWRRPTRSYVQIRVESMFWFR